MYYIFGFYLFFSILCYANDIPTQTENILQEEVTQEKYIQTQEERIQAQEKATQEEYDSLKTPPIKSKNTLANENFFMRLKLYEPFYLLPAYYSFSKPYSNRLQPVDFKTQISFSIDFFENMLCHFCSFSFDYTQKIYLQMYNKAQSSPLRDIDLSPQLSFNYKKPLHLGKDNYINWISIAYKHVSNGETNEFLTDDQRNIPRSKALDRIIFTINYKNSGFNIKLRTWYILNIFDGKRTNPNIQKYIGYGDIKLSYQYRNHLFEFYINNIFNNYFSKEYWDFKGNIELGYSIGISKKFAIFTQYIVGHGDSLYEYNLPVNRIGVGIRLRDF